MLGEMVNRRVAFRIAILFRLAVAVDVVVAAMLLTASFNATRGSDPAPTWTFDMYDARSARYQDPDGNACAAAAAQIMLNSIALQAEQDTIMVRPDQNRWSVFLWQTDTSYSRMESILAYERANMTMLTSSPGTDPHGWRNAVNFLGWGTTSAGIYRDSAYVSFAQAAHAVAISVARYGRPVGILARAGRHAQVVTGVVVTGADPRVSDDFDLVGVYITDPLQSEAKRDFFVAQSYWQSGPYAIRFDPYAEKDSPYTDPIDGHVGTEEWDGKWVIIDAVK